MKFFRRRRAVPQAPPQPRDAPAPAPAPAPPPAEPPAEPIAVEADAPGEIEVSRTLVLSEPELAEVVACHPDLTGDTVAVELAGKGFGTKITLTAAPASGVTEETLRSYLDDLAEQRRRPFSNT